MKCLIEIPEKNKKKRHLFADSTKTMVKIQWYFEIFIKKTKISAKLE